MVPTWKRARSSKVDRKLGAGFSLKKKRFALRCSRVSCASNLPSAPPRARTTRAFAIAAASGAASNGASCLDEEEGTDSSRSVAQVVVHVVLGEVENILRQQFGLLAVGDVQLGGQVEDLKLYDGLLGRKGPAAVAASGLA
jgi:hypothetical protein